MINKKIGAFFAIVVVLALSVGCQRDMGDRGKIEPLQQDLFFPNGSSARDRIKGTVSRDDMRDNSPYYTGRSTQGNYLAGFAIPVDERTIEEGREKYDIYCSVCHGNQGAGDGIVVKKGFTTPLSFSSDKLKSVYPGYYFYVMTNGYGKMDYFHDLLNEQERWSVAAYIKKLISNSQKPQQKSEKNESDRP
ncbi:MAG: cytochrome c [Endomicrobiales bacterium]